MWWWSTATCITYGRRRPIGPRASRRWAHPGTDNSPPLLVDPGLLERVIANPAANALTYGRARGVVAQAAACGDQVELRIVDHGPGIPVDRAESMFAPFQRRGDHKYLHFAIAERDDVEGAVLLALIGLAVTEIALWGRRQQARASTRAGYLRGVVSTARLAASGATSPPDVVDLVARQIGDILDLDACAFDAGPPDPTDHGWRPTAPSPGQGCCKVAIRGS
jgi:hypothetical protein